MRVHTLKTWVEFYEPLALGYKTFEIRKNDRDFQKNDILALEIWDNDLSKYSGVCLFYKVTYVLKDAEQFGLIDGFCILGMKKLDVKPID